MPTLAEKLRETLEDSRFVSPIDGQVVLVESERDAELKAVCVEGVPDGAVVLRMDRTQVQNFVRSARGVGRRADFVLLFEVSGKRFMVHAELKTGERNAVSPHVVEKFKGTDCILEYCESVMARFYGYADAFSGYERRYVLMYKAPSISKLPTRPGTVPLNDRPDRHMNLPVENFDQHRETTKVPIRRFVCP
jgi:hypothetical protein